jgi:hypothetical protein
MATKETMCRWVFTRDGETREKSFFHHVDEAEARAVGGFDETWAARAADIPFEVSNPIDSNAEMKTFTVYFVREQSASVEVQARTEEEAEELADTSSIMDFETDSEPWQFDYVEESE